LRRGYRGRAISRRQPGRRRAILLSIPSRKCPPPRPSPPSDGTIFSDPALSASGNKFPARAATIRSTHLDPSECTCRCKRGGGDGRSFGVRAVPSASCTRKMFRPSPGTISSTMRGMTAPIRDLAGGTQPGMDARNRFMIRRACRCLSAFEMANASASAVGRESAARTLRRAIPRGVRQEDF